jgi:hypothetical protein
MRRYRSWIRVASERAVLRRALVSCVAVGIFLTVVNHGSELLRGNMSLGLVAQIVITLLVPFVVSITSSVGAVADRELGDREPLPERQP